MINEDAPEHKSEKSNQGHEGHPGAEDGAETVGGITQRARRSETVTKVLVEPGVPATADRLKAIVERQRIGKYPQIPQITQNFFVSVFLRTVVRPNKAPTL